MNKLFASLALAAPLLAAGLTPTAASAMPITKTVNINVYQLCDDAGNNCAATGPAGNAYFAAETNQIWAQAGIQVTFSFIQQINSSAFFDLSGAAGDDFGDLAALYGTHGPSTTGVDMFLVGSYAGAYGVGWSGLGGLVMSMTDIMGFDCGGALNCTGRIDTLAHELGHNFGLIPVTDPDYNPDPSDPGHSLNPNHLMAGGGYRNVPVTTSDIAPGGLGLDLLSQSQIDLARSSSLLSDLRNVPEPSGMALAACALLSLGVSARRRHDSGR